MRRRRGPLRNVTVTVGKALERTRMTRTGVRVTTSRSRTAPSKAGRRVATTRPKGRVVARRRTAGKRRGCWATTNLRLRLPPPPPRPTTAKKSLRVPRHGAPEQARLRRPTLSSKLAPPRSDSARGRKRRMAGQTPPHRPPSGRALGRRDRRTAVTGRPATERTGRSHRPRASPSLAGVLRSPRRRGVRPTPSTCLKRDSDGLERDDWRKGSSIAWCVRWVRFLEASTRAEAKLVEGTILEKFSIQKQQVQQ